MIKGYILKRSDTDYVIGCDAQGNGGYNVVPKSVDPCNVYTIENVESYIAEHPDMLLESDTLNLAQIKEEAKAKRDLLISEVEWRRWRNLDEVVLELEPTEPLQPILQYIQALRNIPEQEGFPTNIIWPEVP
jgi:hypothetical protein